MSTMLQKLRAKLKSVDDAPHSSARGGKDGAIIGSSGHKSTFENLLTTLESQARFGKLVEYSLGCLVNLATTDVACEELVATGVLPLLMRLVELHPNNEKVQRLLATLIGKLSCTDKLSRQVMKGLDGDYDWMVHSLNRHSEASTHLATCGCISAIIGNATSEPSKALSQEFIDVLVRKGAVTSLSRLLNEQLALLASSEEKVQRTANLPLIAAITKCLSHLCDGNTMACRTLCTSDCLKNLANQLARGDTNAECARLAGMAAVVTQYADVVTSIATSSGRNLEALRRIGGSGQATLSHSLIVCGGIHAHDGCVTDAIKRALAMLTSGEDMLRCVGDMSRHMRELLVRRGDMKDVAAALERSVREFAHLAMVPANREAIHRMALKQPFRKGGERDTAIDLLTAALAGACTGVIPDGIVDERIKFWSSLGLNRAGHNAHDSDRHAMLKKGMVQALIDWWEKRTQDAKAGCSALGALKAFANNRVHAEFVAQCGLPTVLKAIRYHVDNSDLLNDMPACMLVRHGCELLAALCKYPGIAEMIAKHGGIAVLSACAKAVPFDDAVLKHTFCALNSLCISMENVKKMDDADLLVALLDLLSDLLQDQRWMDVSEGHWLREALLLIETFCIADPDKYIPFFVENGLPRVLGQLLRKVKDKEICEIIQRILSILKNGLPRNVPEEKEVEVEEEDEDEARRILEQEMLEALALMREREELLSQQRLAAQEKRRKEKEQAHFKKLLAQKQAEKEKAEGKAEENKPVYRSAKSLFASEDDHTELDPEVKALLSAGALLTKHSKKALPRPRHVYLSHDMQYLIWKDAKHPVKPSQVMRIHNIHGVTKGRCTPQLQRKRWRKFLADEDRCFSIEGAAIGGKTRTVDLEAKTEEERDIWCEAIDKLIEYARQEKLFGKGTVKMVQNQLYKEKPKEKLLS